MNRENKLEFIQLYADYRLNRQVESQVKAFRRGFESVIASTWLHSFSPDELQTLISGSPSIDIDDLKANCVLKGFTAMDLTLQYLWVVLEGMSTEERQLFLFFVTSCSRPPLLGFKALNPPFCIQKADYGGVYFGENEDKRLPTSSTCMNILRLPDYKEFEVLREKLLYAIKAKSGFDLS